MLVFLGYLFRFGLGYFACWVYTMFDFCRVEMLRVIGLLCFNDADQLLFVSWVCLVCLIFVCRVECLGCCY